MPLPPSHSFPDFSGTLSDATRRWLQSGGWKPGRHSSQFVKWKYGKSDQMWCEYCNLFQCHKSRDYDFLRHPARSILSELFGQRVESGEDVLPGSSVGFWVDEAIGLNEEIADLSEYVFDFLIPIGQLVSLANLSIGVSGRVFASGWVSCGVFLLGESFGDAMERCRLGLPFKLVPLRDKRFHDPDLKGEIWIPSPP